jgi:hypothetical protein
VRGRLGRGDRHLLRLPTATDVHASRGATLGLAALAYAIDRVWLPAHVPPLAVAADYSSGTAIPFETPCLGFRLVCLDCEAPCFRDALIAFAYVCLISHAIVYSVLVACFGISRVLRDRTSGMWWVSPLCRVPVCPLRSFLFERNLPSVPFLRLGIHERYLARSVA